MPYITAGQRTDLHADPSAATPGELNYLFTDALNIYRRVHGDSYTTFNDILCALEGAKLEFYRRIVVPYEEKKCAENGDVY